jgi:DNA-binding NarL/FixJ family response regulator
MTRKPKHPIKAVSEKSQALFAVPSSKNGSFVPEKAAHCASKLKSRIFIVEDHPVTRNGLVQLINYQNDLLVCGFADTVAKAMGGVENAEPDLVMVDVSLPDGHGLELVKDIKALRPQMRILVLSMHDEGFYAERAFRAGASGYVMKQEPTDTVMAAVRRILCGETYLSPRMQERVLNRFATGKPAEVNSDVERLTDRELEVFELIGRGHGTRQIARQLRLGVSTVETHRAHLKEKLDVENGTELTRRAVEWVNSHLG